jgi:transposase InsO family protein
MRWLKMLTHYNYEIHYHPGDKNCVADALSRRAELRPPDREDDIPQCLIPEAKFTELAACEAEMTDSDWADLTNVILTALAFSNEHLSDACQVLWEWEDKLEGLVWDDGLGRKDGRIWIPEDDGLWKKVMWLYHDSLVTGHLGTSGTLELVSRSYWRRSLPDWVKRYVQGCHTCRQAKHRNQHEHGKLQPIPTPDGPWQWIQSDFVGELPKSNGFNTIYVISDRLTKMAHFIPTMTDISAPDLMKLHICHVWKLHGIPLVHGTDRGSTFMANFTRSIYKDLGIEPRFSTAYHPQTQGQVKNNNKWMEMYLRMFYSHRQDDWADLLPTAEFAYNNHHHPSIDTTPFFANYGYHPTLTNVPSTAQSGEPDERIQRIHDTQAECKHAIERSQDISKQAYDKWKGNNPGFRVGSSVWLEVTNLSTDEPSPKLASK